MNDRHGTGQPRPLAYGYFFSLGHSTIVFAIGVAIIIAAKTVLPAVTHSHSAGVVRRDLRHDRLGRPSCS